MVIHGGFNPDAVAINDDDVVLHRDTRNCLERSKICSRAVQHMINNLCIKLFSLLDIKSSKFDPSFGLAESIAQRSEKRRFDILNVFEGRRGQHDHCTARPCETILNVINTTHNEQL